MGVTKACFGTFEEMKKAGVMTSKERSFIANGIWLCETCAKLIDTDVIKYNAETIRKWKSGHETLTSKEQINPD